MNAKVSPFERNRTGWLFLGSSGISGKGCTDLQEEIGIIAESVGDAFDHFDLVVDAFEHASVERIAAVRENPRLLPFEVARKDDERGDAAPHGPAVPLLPRARRPGDGPVAPEFLQRVAQ